MQLQVVCNLCYAIMKFNNCMCRIQLEISNIQQLQNDIFLLMNVWLCGVLGLILKIVGPFGHMNERHDNCLVIGVFMYNSKISEDNNKGNIQLWGLFEPIFKEKSLHIWV